MKKTTAPKKGGRLSAARHLIMGAGGHAKVVLDAALSCKLKVAGLTDNRKDHCGRAIDGTPVLFEADALRTHKPGSVLLINGLGLRDSTEPRRGLYERLKIAGYSFAALKSPSAHIASTAQVAPGVQIMTRAVLHPFAVVGENAVINTGAIVEHDVVIGANAFVSPGAVLCGCVKIGQGAFIGAGAVVLPGIKVGDGCVVAAGTVVNRDVPAGSRVAGVPAHPMGGGR